MSHIEIISRPTFAQRGTQWWLQEGDLVFKYKGETYRARGGNQINGSSVPSCFHWFEEPDTNILGAAFHDPCYQLHKCEVLYPGQNGGAAAQWHMKPISRSLADEIYRQFVIDDSKEGKFHANIMWEALRLGGVLAWHLKTCNGKCRKCPANAAGYCPYQDALCKPGYEISK